MAADLGCLAVLGLVERSALLDAVVVSGVSDTEYNANRPSDRRSSFLASLASDKPSNGIEVPSSASGKSSSNVAHSGFSSLGGNSVSRVLSPLITSSARPCWNRITTCAAWLARVIGYIRMVRGSFIVSSTATVAAPTNSRTPYGAVAMDPRLPQAAANSKPVAVSWRVRVGPKYPECHGSDGRHGDSRGFGIVAIGGRPSQP